MTRLTLSLEWQNWLRLLTISGLGNQAAYKLLRQFGGPEDIFETKLEALETCVSSRIAWAIKQEPNASFLELCQRTSQWQEQDDAHVLYLGHPDYPSQLLEIPDPPLMLYVKGRLNYLQKPMIAIVGSRNATMQGVEHAKQFGMALSTANWCISSGLAAGVDAAAHQGGLASTGGTVAVIGTGIDIVYPARHRDLTHQIADHGCIVSEYHLGTPALAANFPRRNRIISGLAKAVLVVEAAEQSGSLITARLAAEQGRDVFAIPGSIHSPLAKGCHRLIKDGAKLVESANDILDEFSVPITPSSSRIESAELPDQGLLKLLGFDPIHVDLLLQRSMLDSGALNAQLLELEMQGAVEMMAGGLVRRLS